MKKLTLILSAVLASCLISTFAFAELEVYRSDQDTVRMHIRSRQTDAGQINTGIDFDNSLAGRTRLAGIFNQNGTTKFEAQAYEFLTGTAPNFTPKLVIKQDGSVGIGTTAPIYGRLTISGNYSGANNDAGQLVLEDSNESSKGLSLGFDNQSNTAYLYARKVGVGGYFLNLNNNLYVGPNSANVGIGTTDPGTYKLYVNGNSYVNGPSYNNVNALTKYSGYFIPYNGVADGANFGYLLLASAYTNGFVANSEVNGTFTFSRGSIGAGNRTSVFEVHSKSAYDSEYFTVNVPYESAGYLVNLVKVTYDGVQYHAIRLPQTGGGPDQGISFDGIAAGSVGLIVVTDSQITAGSETVFGNIGYYVSSDGKLGIGTTDLVGDDKLKVAGSIKATEVCTEGGKCLSTVGSGNIGGGGNVNYLPKFTAETTLGDSLLYQDGVRIGVGTDTQNAFLDVRGDALFKRTGGTELSLQTPADDARIFTSGGKPLILQPSNDGNFQVGSRLFVDVTTGNVGINTAPGEKLDVSGGNIRSSGNIYSSNGTIFSQVPAVGYEQVYLNKWGLSGEGDMYLEPAAGKNLYLTDNWAKTGTLDFQFGKYTFQGGNVGIGTPEPGAKLDIAGVGWGSIDSTKGIRFGDDLSGITPWNFNPDGSGSYRSLTFYTTGWDWDVLPPALVTRNVMTIGDYGGNVGIGTNNPDGKLDIFNGVSAATNLSLSANYENAFRWKVKTTDRVNGIDLDFYGTDGSDAETLISSFAIPGSGRPSLSINGNIHATQDICTDVGNKCLSAAGSGGVSSVTATLPLASSGGATPDISIPPADGSTNGYLSAANFTTFTNKMTNPMTTLGDIIYGGASGVPTKLAGSAGFLKSTGAVAPSFAALVATDIPSLDASKITTGTFADARIASAATWNAKMTNPMTTLGDIIYGGASGVPTKLAGSAGFLKSTGAVAPSFSALVATDIPSLDASKITSGNLDIARMPTGGSWTLGSDLTVTTKKVKTSGGLVIQSGNFGGNTPTGAEQGSIWLDTSVP